MFEGFRLSTVDTVQASIRVRHGGSGPPLLLLHGSPQTHVMWHLLAPRLAEEFTVILPTCADTVTLPSPRAAKTTPGTPNALWHSIRSR
jgi:hypothetical protein